MIDNDSRLSFTRSISSASNTDLDFEQTLAEFKELFKAVSGDDLRVEKEQLKDSKLNMAKAKILLCFFSI